LGMLVTDYKNKNILIFDNLEIETPQKQLEIKCVFVKSYLKF